MKEGKHWFTGKKKGGFISYFLLITLWIVSVKAKCKWHQREQEPPLNQGFSLFRGGKTHPASMVQQYKCIHTHTQRYLWALEPDKMQKIEVVTEPRFCVLMFSVLYRGQQQKQGRKQ